MGGQLKRRCDKCGAGLDSSFVHPGLGSGLPGDQLLLGEPQSDLLVGRLDGVRSVQDVASDLDAEVSADGSGQGIGGVGGSQHLAAGLDDVQALPDHRDDGSGAHVVDQSGEEGTGAQVSVVLLQELLLGLWGVQGWGLESGFQCSHNLEKTWRGAAGVFRCAITHPHELHGDQLEALLLETLDDLANQSTLDGIGLDHDKSALLVSGHVDSMEKNLLLRILIGIGLVCEC